MADTKSDQSRELALAAIARVGRSLADAAMPDSEAMLPHAAGEGNGNRDGDSDLADLATRIDAQLWERPCAGTAAG